MWMGPNRRCETGFWYFLWHITVFPLSHFLCNIYSLRYGPSTFVASDGTTDVCTVDMLSCYDAEPVSTGITHQLELILPFNMASVGGKYQFECY